MYARCTCRILARVLILGVLAVPTVSRAGGFLATGFRVSFSAEIKGGVGRIYAAARWNKPTVPAQLCILYADGALIAWSSQGRTSATGLVYYAGVTSEQFEVVKEDYFSSPHTFQLEALLYTGERKYELYTYVPADILRIENHVEGLSEMQSGALRILHFADANEGPDDYDVAYNSGTHLPVRASIVSFREAPNGAAPDRLVTDARPKDSVSVIDLRLSLESGAGEPVMFASTTRNELRLSLPRQTKGYDFRPSPMTLQQYDPLDPSVEYAIYDLRRAIGINGGVVSLPPLKGSYDSGVPYAYFKLSFATALPADLNRDGTFNLRDFAVLARDWRFVAMPTIADTAGPKGPGIPDGNVNANDLRAFCREWGGDAEGFESGRFDELGWFGAGDAYWVITSSESHGGLRSARAGAIGDGQRSRLMITIKCRAGEVTFWRKVSSEKEYDLLQFRSGGTLRGEWSGELDWERVAFQVEAGLRTFSWDYVKDSSGSMGSDTAWIDLVSFPTSGLGQDDG